MRIRERLTVFLLLAILLSIIAVGSSASGDRHADSQKPSSSGKSAGDYFARVLSIEADSAAMFHQAVHECYLPVWKPLRGDGIVFSVSVFELVPYDSTTADPSAKEYLILAGLDSGAAPDDLLDAEQILPCPGHRRISASAVLRSALMSCTPNSCHGMPEPFYPDAESGIVFLVELIGVEETPHARAKYRELMVKFFGPANGILVERGMLHCFVALENVDLLSSTPNAVPWNQIHISDDWDAGGDVDWDSVYTDLFHSEFSCDLDSVWSELPPTDETYADYHARLIPELCVR
jgi:hypothetical protein